MNRYTFALLVALLIHLLFVLSVWIFTLLTPTTPNKPTDKEKKIKVSLKELPKKNQTSQIKQKPKHIIKPKEMPKGSQLKKVVKKQLPKSIKPKVKKVINIKPTKIKKPYIPLLAKEDINTTTKEIPTKIKKKDLGAFAWMYKDMSTQENKRTKEEKSLNQNSNINQNIKELYGVEFGKLSVAQQEYILNNQEIMRRITQQVLNRVAGVNIKNNINVNTENIIEFYLYPNGNMSDFRFLKKSGYFVLDDTTKETIEYSYAKYPRPKEKTLIRYNVFYNLRY